MSRNSRKLTPKKNDQFVEEENKPKAPPPRDEKPPQKDFFGLSFVTPEEEVVLPSRGQFYPIEHPMHGKETITIKHMTAKEEDILSSLAQNEGETTFDRLTKSLVVDKNIDITNLLEEDKLAILLAARVTGYGSEYTTLSYCQNCSKETKHIFDLSKTSIKDPDDNVKYNPERNTFIFTTPKTKIELELSNEIESIEKSIQQEKEKKEKYNIPFNRTVAFLEKVIISANSVTDIEMIKKLINVLPAAEGKIIKDFYNSCRPQISTKQEVECQVCGNTSEKEAPFTWALFRTDA